MGCRSGQVVIHECKAHIYLFVYSVVLWGVLLHVFMVCVLQAVCIENSCLVRGSKEGSNGAMHLTTAFLKPAESSMYKILYDRGNFKYVNEATKTFKKTSL